MRTYEALYIAHPELGDEDIQTISTNVEKLITDNGGTIVRSEIWGKRRLAYEVKKLNEGIYILLRFQAEPDFIARLESYFRLADDIIRSLVVHFDEQMLRLEAEQAVRKEKQLAAAAAAGPDDDDDDDRRPRRRRRMDDDDDDDDEEEEE